MSGRSINKVWIGKGRSQQSFNVLNVKTNMPTRLAKHPVETGEVIMDNKVVDPIEIEVSILLVVSDDNFPSQRAFLNAARNSRSADTYTVCTKYDSYFDMIIESIDDDESNDKFDATVMNVKFVQLLPVTAMVTGGINHPIKPENKDGTTSGVMNASKSPWQKVKDVLRSEFPVFF